MILNKEKKLKKYSNQLLKQIKERYYLQLLSLMTDLNFLKQLVKNLVSEKICYLLLEYKDFREESQCISMKINLNRKVLKNLLCNSD